MSFFTPENLTMVFGVLFGVSEALSVIPAVKSNGVFQLILNLLSSLAGKTPTK